MMDFVSIPESRMNILRKNKKFLKKLEELVNVKIKLAEEVEIESDDPLLVICSKQVIKGFGRGFDFDDALLLLDEEYLLDVIDIKEFSGKSQKRLVEMRGRIIGTKGKTKDIMEKLTETKISVYGKTVGIIGKWDSVQNARYAIELLLQGRKHGSIYRFLEEKAKSSLK
jgi:ribosomal RNA assembly protein